MASREEQQKHQIQNSDGFQSQARPAAHFEGSGNQLPTLDAPKFEALPWPSSCMLRKVFTGVAEFIKHLSDSKISKKTR